MIMFMNAPAAVDTARAIVCTVQSGKHSGMENIVAGNGPTVTVVGMFVVFSALAIAAYSYMGLVPVIQPPVMRLLTTKKERLIRMKPARMVSKREKVLFPIVGFLITAFIAPGALPLLGMLFFGNL